MIQEKPSPAFATEEWLQWDERHVWHPFTQAGTAPPVTPIVAARGASLYGPEGQSYLDLISSWWVITHGHGHPRIALALAQQAMILEQVVFAGFTHPPAAQLAAKLVARLPEGLSRLFFSDNGSTAVEVALKMARQYWYNQGKRKERFLAFQGGYHGDTVGAMSVGGSSGFFEPFRSLLFPVDWVPFPATWQGDAQVDGKEREALHALDRYLSEHGSSCAACLMEPLVQGAAGMRMCRPQFVQQVAERLRAAGVLLIFDEVMTGFGRTGTLFACQRAATTPDIICLSKGLTGGFLPMSVTVCREEIYQAFVGDSFDRAFAHGHSFTANPLGCAAALVALALFEEENTLPRIAQLEAIHQARVTALADHPRVRYPRVVGSIAALDIVADDAGYASRIGLFLRKFFLERGFLLRPLGNALYLLPPYCISDSELHQAWDCVAEALHQLPPVTASEMNGQPV
ncbi:MAG: adenosylmethionine--8-amino-7-oxononanoate transaminase [Magnetococcales bacterium]|nr:adenosylmethionine--8-amino-7-oxononanoate transaminase [Magnetococcales bacterium]